MRVGACLYVLHLLILFSLYLVNNVGFAYEHSGMIAEISAEVIEPYVH